MTQQLQGVPNKNVATPGNTKATLKAIHTLRKELNDLYPERENLITQMIYGLLIREHVLVYGKFGTGKSQLLKDFFGSFIDSHFFSVELNKFMTESNIIGVPNPKKLREDGILHYERAGMILDAQFVELDEFLDANDPLLRSMLGILNERRFNRGTQREKALLHMAVASTNANPKTEVSRLPALGAVIDRFLLQTSVEYLAEGESRRQMYANYLDDKKPTVRISYKDIEALTAQVKSIEISDPLLIALHNDIVVNYAKESDSVISDRRACKSLELVRANAMLFGRDNVLTSDFKAVVWSLCHGHDVEKQKLFTELVDPLIEKVNEERAPDIIATQLDLMTELEGRVPTFSDDEASKFTNDELVTLARQLTSLTKTVADISPAHETVTDQQKKLNAKVSGLQDKVNGLILGTEED